MGGQERQGKILSLHSTQDDTSSEKNTVTSPPRRVPSLYPTSPPAGMPLPENMPKSSKPIAHSLRPKANPVTIESLREERSALALTNEESIEQNLYDLFEVDPHVSDEELRRAYKRMWACFHPDHCSSYGLYSRAQLEALLDQFQKGFELLMDPEKRKDYDTRIFPNGVPQKKVHQESSSRLAPTLQPIINEVDALKIWPTLTQNSLGAKLGGLREQFNVSLSTIHERSKISISMLEYIEQDNFEKLPALIYLKGFLKELLILYSLQKHIDLETEINFYHHQV